MAPASPGILEARLSLHALSQTVLDRLSSAPDAWLGYSRAGPITSAPCAFPSICWAWAAPAVGVNTTVGPDGAAPIWSFVGLRT